VRNKPFFLISFKSTKQQMKRHIITVFILLLTLTGTVVQAQSVIKIDSLKKVLVTEATDTATLKKYLVLAVSKLQTNNTEARLIILDWLIAASKKINHQQMEANGYCWKGFVYQAAGRSDLSIEWLTKALEFSHTIGYAYIENNANIGLGSFYFNNEQYDKALPYFLNAIEVSKKNNFQAALGSAYLNIANVIYGASEHSAHPKYDEVIRYMKLSLEIAEKRKDTVYLIKTNIGIGTMYNLKKEYQLSENYMKVAAPYLDLPQWKQLATDFYGNLGEIYKVQNKHKEAIENFQKGLTMLKIYPDPNLEYQIYGSLGDSYEAIGDYSNAYKNQLKYSLLHDSLMKQEKFAASAELEVKYQQAVKDKEISRLGAEQKIRQLELEKQKAIIAGNFLEAERKEDEIKLLSQEKELQDLQLVQQEQVLGKNKLQATADSQQIQLGKQEALLQEKQISNQKRTRNYLIGGLGILGILAFILYRNITAKKKAYIALQHKSEQIKEQALQLSKQAKQIAQFQSQMNPHFVYNALHNIQGMVLTDEKQKANSQIQSLAQLMRKTFANADKDDIPLEEEINYLNKYIEFEKNAFGNNLDFEVLVTKDAEGTMVPPMMIQPFIENAIKHAELKKVINPYIKVLIEIENNLLAINITDNGTGIKKEATEGDKLSHSLSVIKSRLDLLFKGRADVNNQPVFSVKTMPELNEGTSVKFYLPLNYSY
jgi:Histidine kinase/Tetratricopeptide repeat